jgi:hypothetical protein
MAFIVSESEQPAIEVCVNFGVFAGRDATRAEIDRLAAWLLDEVGEVSIISEERLETDGSVEASVHQVRIQVANGAGDREALSTGRVSAWRSATQRSLMTRRIWRNTGSCRRAFRQTS